MLLVGIVVGTYSSIFIASPVLVEWQAAVMRRRERRAALAA
jgi:preprotein translocase subunit SecF